MDFISLAEVLDGVKSQVQIPEEYKNATLDLPDISASQLVISAEQYSKLESSNEFQAHLFRNFLLGTYRQSKAAAMLDLHLDDTNGDELEWIDFGPTGLRKRSRTARNEGVAILVHVSRNFENYASSYQATVKLDGRWVFELPSTVGQFAKKEDGQRLREIGFERSLIINFLYDSGVPHNLGDAFMIPWDRPVDLKTSELDLGNISQLGKNSASPSPAKVHRSNNRAHPMRRLIDKALVEAGELRNDFNHVYSILTKMAKQENPELPMICFDDRKGIKYQSKETFKYYKSETFRKYYVEHNLGEKSTSAKNVRKIRQSDK